MRRTWRRAVIRSATAQGQIPLFSEGPIEDLGPVDARRNEIPDEQATAEGAADPFRVSADMRAMAEKAMTCSERGMALSFEFARNLVRARDAQDVLRLQKEYVNAQMQLFSEHAQTIPVRMETGH